MHPYENPKDITVLITLSEASIGGRAYSEIHDVSRGFDWEYGQLRIEPSKKLISKGTNSKNIKSVICKEYLGKKYYICPNCNKKIAKNDCFCRECGQRLK